MTWQALTTEPLDVDAGVAPARARAIAAALTRRVLPLLALRDGRAEPLASAALFRIDGRVVLLTCRHLFDAGVAIGDLAVPRAGGGLLWLAPLAARVLVHPQRDLALVDLAPGRLRDELLRCWPAAPLAEEAAAAAPRVRLFALAGWPYAQMRRVEQVLHARPLVLLAPVVEAGDDTAAAPSLRLRYARIARRCDGVDVHAPELDGMSGAVLWALHEASDGHHDCLLRPAAVQSAFKPGAYLRGEPLTAAAPLFARLRQGASE